MFIFHRTLSNNGYIRVASVVDDENSINIEMEGMYGRGFGSGSIVGRDCFATLEMDNLLADKDVVMTVVNTNDKSLNSKVPEPTASPDGGTFSSSQNVTLTCDFYNDPVFYGGRRGCILHHGRNDANN